MMSKFQEYQSFIQDNNNYSLLPFRFSRLDEDQVFLSNIAGQYLVLNNKNFDLFAKKKLEKNSELYNNLRTNHFLYDDLTEVNKKLLAIKYKTRINNLSDFTKLHMFVISLRCEHSCPYCQVSRQSQDKQKFDMTKETADKAIDLVFQSPSKNIKIEFQGGEPLLNFEILKYIVLEAKARKPLKKNLDFVIATNLALINDEVLDFCKLHGINISTSLDGPKDLHNKNRPRPGNNSYEKAIEGIKKVKNALGPDAISALMTTTLESMDNIEAIIDEYIKNDFNGIFLRPLSPYGFAIKTKYYDKYSVENWIEFYKKGLKYILDINKSGINFIEFYSTIILKKMLTFQTPGYVDLMSPAGTGIAAVVYNYDGSIYASDEGRMLAENKDFTFKLGDVTQPYKDIFASDKLIDILDQSYSKSAPMCSDCAFEDYCGSDPVYHYATQKDYVGNKAHSDFCKRNMFLFKYLVKKMQESKDTEKLFRFWATQC